jgi:hypothetical protein
MEGSLTALQAYNIQQIPANYLLDREANIVYKNLKGPDLDKAVGNLIR